MNRGKLLGLRAKRNKIKNRKLSNKNKKIVKSFRIRFSDGFLKALDREERKRDSMQIRLNDNASKPELKVKEILQKNNIKFIQNYEILGKYYDFYVPDFNLLIEVDGIYFHYRKQDATQKPKLWQIENMVNDRFKNALAKIKKIKLIRIWEDEISEIQLIKEIKSDKIV